MPRLLLFAATTGYQIRTFAEAATRLGVALTLATDRCHILDDPWGDRAIPVRFHDVLGSLAALSGRQFDGVAAVGDGPTVLAAEVAAVLGLPFHPVPAVRACRDKHLARRLFRAAGLRVPDFFRVSLAEQPHFAAHAAPYPCVLKPLGLSGSRGVIRANNPDEFTAAFARIKALLEQIREEKAGSLQVEAYIPGREFAVEGVVTHGQPRVLAIFDKPDPLEGPFFEETIYVTPSREPQDVQRAIREAVESAVRALDLSHGPFHAELRLNDAGAWMLEVAARPIGGLCSRAVNFEGGMPLEEFLLRHALGEDVSALQVASEASGVMMIPIPKAGIYQSVTGAEDAGDVIITAKQGQMLIPLPEGASYLGFIFARGSHPEEVEQSLRDSHARLDFQIDTALPTLRP